ncbi:MAG: protease [Acidobacteria bacterium RIFCSPLOWO2_02_FULL_67_36]|nr:MAG: protease [Acidobacteria bacterium RIFCSPLOWO2_02_FULL_67_36]OFW19891.1 MAG: protease [Acidobacteria bacterium RIFCSPLOWO2_12_FULL_66_21]
MDRKVTRLAVSHLLCGLLGTLVLAGPAEADSTRLLRRPAVSRDLVAFGYGGDIWVVSRNGGQARRLTSTPGFETDPHFSPDGSKVAFTATVAGNTDVYVVPAAGGEPLRLTFHPAVDCVRGWTPDGRRVLFASSRGTLPTPGANSYFRLWTVALDGSVPDALPIPRAFAGTYSPDGKRVAYEEIATAMFAADWAQNQASQWRHHRGGRTHPIRLLSLADSSAEKLPWANSNDSDPIWIGDTVYFLSDRSFTTNLFAYRIGTKQVTQLTKHDDFDIMSASGGPDAVVYEQAGYIHLVDAKTGQSRQLSIDVSGDFPWARPQHKKVANMVRAATLSPTGVRAALEARGEIFTVPAEKGQFRNLTQSPGVHDRSPVWSPDGTEIAWLSDASGEYQLMIGDQTGTAKPRAIALPGQGFFAAPVWSPDGKRLLLDDNHLHLWAIELATGAATKIDTDTYDDPGRGFDAVWSPDSRWVAYSKSLDSHLRAIFVYSLADQKTRQLTDGLSDATNPAFDAGGKYLYFLSSTNYALRTGWLEMTSVDRPVTRSIYLVVLSASEPSPFLPETGDEPGVPEAGAAPASKPAGGAQPSGPPAVRIDFEQIGQRILALGVPAADYSVLMAGAPGTIYYLEPPRPAATAGMQPPPVLQRYVVRERRAAPFLEGIRSYALSADKKKLLYRADGNRWGVVATDRPAKVGDGPLDVARIEMWVDPHAEWAQIFRETWRIERDFFYDAGMHGADWPAIYKKYEPMLPYVQHRADLGYLIASVGGELSVGHSYLTGAGDEPGAEPVSVGLLGADFEVENGRYRIKRIYTGENWNPELQAPLSAPGVQVHEGDYLLEVNGRPLVPPANLYRFFEATAGRQTLIRVSDKPSLEGSRLVTVVPVASDEGLRTRAWIEGNRRLVDKLSGGRLAYVWLPNTGGPGYTAFNRYFYAQQDKDGAVIDERYNQGGMVADYIVNELDRKLMGYFARRDGKPSPSPTAGIYGPKVMVINESAGSGGDALPYYFKLRKIGPLVGTRTWGGLVGTLTIPPTIDGGGITAPSLAFYDLNGKWAVENEGVAPDIEVENTPAAVMAGHDPQLERAVQEAMKLLEQQPTHRVPRPAPPNRVSPTQKVPKK